ncbi:MAG: hypothetical protein B7Z55_05900 [Planctomycetales bacterium 12-60-4]|nr:MAG: hypothetical protein B7Z55_05900 [Planctomycetales bacterium 12-60-4]
MTQQRWGLLILSLVIGLTGCGQSPPAGPPASATPEVPTAATPGVEATTPDSVATPPMAEPVAAVAPEPKPAPKPTPAAVVPVVALAAPIEVPETDSPTGLSWRVYLLPYLDQAPLYNQFHTDEPWDSDHNKQFIAQMPAIFGDNAEGKTRLHVFTGEGAPFQSGAGIGLRDVLDGTSNTFAVVEAGEDTAEIWTKPSGLEFDAKNALKSLGNVGETFLALMMDGAVFNISKDVDGLANLIQHADGQVVPGDFRTTTPAAPVVDAEPLPPLPPLAAAAAEVDTRLIPADAVAAAIIQPRRFLEHELVQSVLKSFNTENRPPREFLAQSLPREFTRGLDQLHLQVDAVEEVRMVLGAEMLEFVQQPHPGIPPMAAALRSATPLDIEVIVAGFTRSNRNIEEREHAGVTYLCDPNFSVSLCFLSEREMVSGHEAVVQAMLSAGGVDTPLTQRLCAKGNRLALAALASDEMGPLLGQMAQQMPQQAQLFMPFISQWNGLSAAIDLDAEELVMLSLQFQKPELAGGLNEMLQGQLQFGRDMFEQQTEALGKGPMAAALPLLTELLNGATLSAEGNALTLTVARPEHLSELPAALAPAVQEARIAAQRAQQKNMLKQIGLAMHNFHDVYNHFPALDGGGAPDPKKGLSWRVHLLPFLDQAPLYNQFKLDEPWDSEHNKQFIAMMPAIFGADPEGKSSLHVFTEGGAPFKNGEGVRIQDITDGTSNTLMVVEAGADTAEIWTKPGGLEFDPENPLMCLGTLMGDGFNALCMDGAVRYISKNIDAETFRRLVQFADGEPLNQF